jgi:hypothetical protein
MAATSPRGVAMAASCTTSPPDKRLVAVDIKTTPMFQAGAPAALFQTRVPASANVQPLRVMVNWTARGPRD